MRRDDAAYLLDMLLHARDAQEFVAGLTYQEFDRSRLHQLAVMKSVETIGEAASRIGEDTRRMHPDIPWSEIVGMRNRIVHAYSDVRLDILWRVVQDELPALIDQLEPLIPPETD